MDTAKTPRLDDDWRQATSDMWKANARTAKQQSSGCNKSKWSIKKQQQQEGQQHLTKVIVFGVESVAHVCVCVCRRCVNEADAIESDAFPISTPPQMERSNRSALIVVLACWGMSRWGFWVCVSAAQRRRIGENCMWIEAEPTTSQPYDIHLSVSSNNNNNTGSGYWDNQETG